MSLDKKSLSFNNKNIHPHVSELIENTLKMSTTYNGPYTAAWLHSPIYANQWKVNQPYQTRTVNGALIKYRLIDWDIYLNDSSKLKSPPNQYFAENMQRLAFLAKESPNGKEPPNNASHINFIIFLLNVTRWAFLHKDEIQPQTNFLSNIDARLIREYIYSYSEGGYNALLGYPQKLIAALYINVFDRPAPNHVIMDPYSMEDSERQKIIEWLYTNNFIDYVGSQKYPFINRIKIYSLIGVPPNLHHSSLRFSVLLQFFTKANIDLVIPNDITTEFFSHRTSSVTEARTNRVSANTIKSQVNNWRELLSLKKHFINGLPEIGLSHLRQIARLSDQLGANPKHTPWIPIKVALQYTQEALRWVHQYGESLVDLFLNVHEYCLASGYLDTTGLPRSQIEKNKKHCDNYIRNSIPEILKPLNISGSGNIFNTYRFLQSRDYDLLRTEPTLNDAMSVLLGAIITIIGITKPMRQAEIFNLESDCLEFVENDGYWIEHHQGKRGFRDQQTKDSRPIPTITAKAITIVKKLSDRIKEIHAINDPFLLSRLFVIPRLGGDQTNVEAIGSNYVNKLLDFFCDYVGIPPDKHSRRWYIRVHEMRKSFLITFFWCFRYGSLDVARWIANHSDSEHIYAYIQANFPGEELPAIEADYAMLSILDYEENTHSSEVSNLETIHRRVCKNFKVASISLIDAEELKNWLFLQFKKGTFQITPYYRLSEDGSKLTEIAFKIKKA